MESLRVGVMEENEILLGGVVAALSQDPELEIVPISEHDITEGFDIAVVPAAMLERVRVRCPAVVLNDHRVGTEFEGANVVCLLPREGLTAEKLLLAVRAGAAGLRIAAEVASDQSEQPLDARRLEVLRALAEGASTRAIADRLKYSERTVKTLVRDIRERLGAQNRAQAVAEAFHRGLI